MADEPITPAPSNPANLANPPPPTGADPNKGEGGDGDKPPQTVPYDRFKKELEKRKEQDVELEKFRKEEQQRKEKEALDKGQHEKVIAELRPKADRADTLEKTLNSVIEAEMQQIPEEKRALVPDLPAEKKLEWIVKNRVFLTDDKKKKDMNHPMNPADGSPSGDDKTIFTLAQIQDSKFYEKNRDAILKAQREGRVRD